jgi:hypothetical protein
MVYLNIRLYFVAALSGIGRCGILTIIDASAINGRMSAARGKWLEVE